MNAKKLLSMLLSAALAVTTLAGCGEGTNYSNEAVKAANEAQSTVVFETDSDLAKSLQDALEDYTQTSDIKTAMVADENLKDLLTSGYQLDVYAAQGEDAEAAAQAIAQQYIVNIVSGKQSEGKIAMILHKGNGYYYAAVLTYRTGGGSGSGGSGGSSSGDGDEDNKPVVLEKIEITEAPSNIDYIVGDDFDQTGMEVTAYYSDGSSRKLNNSEYEIDGKDLNTAGTKTVTVRYTEGRVTKEDTVEVYVADVKAVKIEVTELPETNYTVGDVFDPEGMKVTITYNDDHTEVFENGMNCEFTSEKPFKTVGDQEVTISCEGLETSIPVFVAEKEYKVTVKVNGEGGTVSRKDGIVKGNETFTFTATPKAGYEFDSVKANGQAETSFDKETNKVTVSNVQSDVTIEVYFKQTLYTVTVKFDGGNGSVDGDHPFTTTGAGTFTIIPETGYKVDKVKVTSGEGEAKLNNGNKVTLSGVSSDITVTVYLEAIKYNVTLNIEGDGTVKLNETSYSDNKTITVKHGDPLTIEAIAGQGYKFDSISDGTNPVNNGATLTITGNVNITVKFEPIQYAVTVNIDGQGTVKYNTEEIKDNGQIFVEYGKTIDLIIDAEDGWKIEKVNNAEDSGNNTYTVGPVKDNMTVAVKFVEKPYVTKIEVKTSTIKTNYECGEQLNLDNMTITVFYSNSTSKDFTVDQDEVVVSHIGKNTYHPNGLRPGYWQAKFDIQYKGKTDTITVDVTCHNYSGFYTSRNCSVCENWDGEHYCKQFGSKPHKCKNN